MPEAKKLFGMAAVIVLAAAMSTSAFAVSKHTARTAAADVRQLVRMMDRDQNGVVSRDEFMQFMGETFDRLDINKSGQLESNELRPLVSGGWAAPAPGQAH